MRKVGKYDIRHRFYALHAPTSLAVYTLAIAKVGYRHIFKLGLSHFCSTSVIHSRARTAQNSHRVIGRLNRLGERFTFGID